MGESSTVTREGEEPDHRIPWKLIDPGENGRGSIRDAISRVLCAEAGPPVCPWLDHQGVACTGCERRSAELLAAVEGSAVLCLWSSSGPEPRRPTGWREGDTFAAPAPRGDAADTTLATLAVIPPAGSEERDFWLEAAAQHGFTLTLDGLCYLADEDEVLKLMSEARKQGQRDVLEAQDAPSPDRLTLHVERGDTGLWYVTIPQDKGLLVAMPDLANALAGAPGALADLAKAREDSALATGGARG